MCGKDHERYASTLGLTRPMPMVEEVLFGKLWNACINAENAAQEPES